MGKHKRLLIIVSTSALVIAAFSLPWLWIYYFGGKEIRDISTEIRVSSQEPKSIIKEIIKWESNNMRNIYQHPHSFDLRFYILPEPPFTYARLLDPTWIMFFKCGACREYAELFTELARIAGLDARVVHNLGIDHAWAETKINENWVHVDPSKINPITKEMGIINDPDYYERPENENGEGKQLFFVYAIDDTGGVHDVTDRYVKETGELVVYVEREGEPVVNARVIVKNTQGSSTPFLTNENGICTFNLGEGNYTIIAESGGMIGYRTERDVLVVNSENYHILLSLKGLTFCRLVADILTFVVLVLASSLLVVLSLIIIVAFKKEKNFIKLFKRYIKADSLTTARILSVIVVCAYAVILAVGMYVILTLRVPQNGLGYLFAIVVMGSWIFFCAHRSGVQFRWGSGPSDGTNSTVD